MTMNDTSLYANYACRQTRATVAEKCKGDEAHLLTKTYSGPSIEWQKRETIRDQIFLEPIIKETVWIEFLS